MKAVFDFSKWVVDKNITFCFFISFFIIKIPLMAQETVLDEVVVSSPRIEFPADQQSRSVTILTAEEIEESGAATLIDVLSDVAGRFVQSVVDSTVYANYNSYRVSCHA